MECRHLPVPPRRPHSFNGAAGAESLAACRRALADAANDLTFTMLGEAYAQAPSVSFDYAIAEKASNLVCVPLETSWSDFGS
jgi:mannose-1-phosphate guanylyltransferase